MKKRIIILLCTCFLSGCQLVISNESLMKPPGLVNTMASLEQTILSHLSSEAVLMTPLTGEHQNVKTVMDLDRDGTLEAVVFYKENEHAIVKGLLFSEKDGEWTKVQTFLGDGNTLYELEIKDVTNDGVLDVIAGFSFRNDGKDARKGLAVYQYDLEKLNRVFNNTYTHMLIDDLNQDGVDELVTILFDQYDVSGMFVFNYTNNKMVLMDNVLLNTRVNALNVISGYVALDQKAIVIDTFFGNQEGFTDYILFDGTELSYVFDWEPIHPTYKSYMILSEDTNHDGIIEAGVPYIPDNDDKELNLNLLTHRYYQWDGVDDMILINEIYDSIEYGYRFDFPNEWTEGIHIETSDENKEVRFIKNNKLLFDIHVIPASDFKNIEGKFILARKNNLVYYTTFSDSELYKKFRLL
ncbi:hypothetical protein [Chengkuizengella axinellae]|uniref:VCBS repeat-containing protein n=1 Tax=Chengkuizengella axinellae TaxID=3064388 RepID=A0ABT9ITN2_9BACL|nr:hypothetical protein [Chengkuizengella sp. 2205SS18-9]MDP5272711.1 hypothetical protein [Chengkuizengella sp. 2205SS18-9]